MTDNPAPTEATNGNDLLYRATVDDQTAAFFNRFDANVTKSGNAANAGFGNVTKASNSSNASLTKLAAAFGLATSISTMFFNALAKGVRDLQALLAESVQAAAQYDRLGTTMYALGAGYGYSTQQLDAYQKSMEASNMSMQGARQAVVRMLQAQIDLGAAQKLAQMAADLSVISNTSVATTMDRIVRSIQVLQPRYLRTMGIYVDVRKANEDYAKSMGTTVDKLDEETKRTIFLNAVLEKAKDIQGAYAASLKTVAGQSQLQQQQLDNLKVTLGELAQPTKLEWLKTWNSLLSDALKWLDANRDTLSQLASDVGNVAATAFRDLANVIQWVFKAFSDVVKEFGVWGDAIAGIKEPEGIKKTASDIEWMDEVIRTAIKLAGLFEAAWAWTWTIASERASEYFQLIKAGLSGNWDEFNRLNAIINSDADDLRIMIDGANAFDAAIGKTITRLDEMDQAKTDAANAPPIVDEAEINALDTFNQGLQDLHDKLEQQAADLATKKSRDAIENALQDAWKQEDMARDLADSLADIEANGQDDKLKLVKDFAEKRWKVEHDYVIALKKLKENFEFDANEAARKRDAVELMALSRKYNKDLKDLKDNKKEQNSEAKKNYDDAVKDLNDSLQKQVKKANDAYQKQEDDLYRSKQRDAIIQQLHDKWALEDIQTQTDRELKALVDQYNALDGATQDGLNQMLADWGSYYTDLYKIIGAGQAGVSSALSNSSGVTPGTKPGTHPSSSSSITGQAGQVTSFLTPSGMETPFGISRPAALDTVPVTRLPTVAPTSGTVRKELAVTVNGNGLNPYIQRQLVRTLTEIERNSS